MDIFVEKILTTKLHEGKLSLAEFNCIMNYIEKLIEKKEIHEVPVFLKKKMNINKEKEAEDDD